MNDIALFRELVFEAARTLDVLRYAIAMGDAELAAAAGRRFAIAVARLTGDFPASAFAADDGVEASALVDQLRARALLFAPQP